MLGWLAKKGQQSRVYMCIKEVKWDLESADAVRRAMIVAMATIIRVDVIEGSGLPQEVLNRPLDYSRDDLMRFYVQLEDIRNANNLQIQNVQKMMRRFGTELPDFAIEHAKLTGRALEVWMCTIGAGIAVDRRDLAPSGFLKTESERRIRKAPGDRTKDSRNDCRNRPEDVRFDRRSKLAGRMPVCPLNFHERASSLAGRTRIPPALQGERRTCRHPR